VLYLKINQQITNVDYQRIVGCPARTATRDLNLMVNKGIIELRGKGRGAHYLLLKKRAINAPSTPAEKD
jgi:Fic family protein